MSGRKLGALGEKLLLSKPKNKTKQNKGKLQTGKKKQKKNRLVSCVRTLTKTRALAKTTIFPHHSGGALS